MGKVLTPEKTALLHSLADAYETPSFINGDPSCFMHKVKGELNQETMAWIASVLKACTGLEVVKALCQWYSAYELNGLVPKNTTSCCKRVCMMMRWMVRDNSPVDLGLWNGLVDKRTLIIPMDTHVIDSAIKLGLITSKSATMSAAIYLTNVLREAFPTDPLKADFALFGAGIANGIDSV